MTTRKKKIRDYYDKLTCVYSDLYGAEQSAKHGTIIKLMGKRHFGVAIDLGCGDGKLGGRLGGMSDRIVGLELSRKMLQILKRSRAGDSADVVQGDAFHAPFRDRIAGCVTSISVGDPNSLNHLLSEAARIAVIDSLILVSVLHPSGPPPDVSSKLSGEKQVEKMALSGRETLYLLSAKPVLKNE